MWGVYRQAAPSANIHATKDLSLGPCSAHCFCWMQPIHRGKPLNKWESMGCHWSHLLIALSETVHWKSLDKAAMKQTAEERGCPLDCFCLFLWSIQCIILSIITVLSSECSLCRLRYSGFVRSSFPFSVPVDRKATILDTWPSIDHGWHVADFMPGPKSSPFFLRQTWAHKLSFEHHTWFFYVSYILHLALYILYDAVWIYIYIYIYIYIIYIYVCIYIYIYICVCICIYVCIYIYILYIYIYCIYIYILYIIYI